MVGRAGGAGDERVGRGAEEEEAAEVGEARGRHGDGGGGY